MLAEYKTKTNIGVGVGILLQIVGRALLTSDQILGIPVALAGVGFFLYGCFSYAKGKGYPSLLGLLGLLSCLGLIVMVLLPDKHKNG